MSFTFSSLLFLNLLMSFIMFLPFYFDKIGPNFLL